MEINSSTLFTVLISVVLVLIVFGFIIIFLGALIGRPARKTPLIETKDGHFEVNGKRVTCSHCGGTKFKAQEVLLNTWLLSLLRMDWLDSSSTVLSCDGCGQLTWFSQEG